MLKSRNTTKVFVNLTFDESVVFTHKCPQSRPKLKYKLLIEVSWKYMHHFSRRCLSRKFENEEFFSLTIDINMFQKMSTRMFDPKAKSGLIETLNFYENTLWCHGCTSYSLRKLHPLRWNKYVLSWKYFHNLLPVFCRIVVQSVRKDREWKLRQA
jgi:hypothetical protein